MRLVAVIAVALGLATTWRGGVALAQGLRFELVADVTEFAAGAPVMLSWRLDNQSDRPVMVLAGMETPGRIDFDPIVLELRGADGERQLLGLMGKRSAVRPVFHTMQPGERLRQPFDLAAFAAMNGIRMVPGTLMVQASYEFLAIDTVPAAGRTIAFTGRLSAPPLRITLKPPP